MIAVIDYGAGNLQSVKKALDFLGLDSLVTSDPAVVRATDKLILPGVGHFSATAQLTVRGLPTAIAEEVRAGKPFLGICVGMQWLFQGSAEASDTPALDFFAGRCERFSGQLKVPHVGWNSLQRVRESRLLEDVQQNSFVYFTHSYYAPLCSDTVATTNYGLDFAAVVERENVFGVQFHPEKSGATGLHILKNFGEIAC